MDTFLPLLAILAAVTGLFLLVAGLIVAPWQLLLIILVLGLLTIRWLMAQNQLSSAMQNVDSLNLTSPPIDSAPTSPPIEHSPALTYRGASYQPSPDNSSETTPVEVIGKYRGSAWKKSV